MTIRKLLAVKNVTEQRKLGTSAYNNKLEWKNQAKKAGRRVRGGLKRDCM
jgi:hypothetical protein